MFAFSVQVFDCNHCSFYGRWAMVEVPLELSLSQVFLALELNKTQFVMLFLKSALLWYKYQWVVRNVPITTLYLFCMTAAEMEAKYHFTYLRSKDFNIFTNRTALDYLMKWSIKGQLKLATFCFNECFQSYQKQDLVEDFFKDAVVVGVLNQMLPSWPYTKDMVEKIETEVVPCTVSSMSFFDRLLDETNNIVRSEGYIRRCLDDIINGFMVADELRKMLIDEESDNYGLFNESERSELIYRIFQFLVLGGKWCQYEDKINPYLDLTKILYKDLLRVEKNPETKAIEIKSLCLKTKLMGKRKMSIFPVDEDHPQNFSYVVVDPILRQLTLFAHEYGGQF